MLKKNKLSLEKKKLKAEADERRRVGELLLPNKTSCQLVSIGFVNSVGVDLHPIFLKNHVLF